MKRPLQLLLLALAAIPELVDGRVKLSPDSTQFFEYQDQVNVSCEDLGPDDWTVWRFTKSGDLSRCGSGWGAQTRASVCDVKTLKPHDSGLYWCESKYRDVSPRVNVIVTGGPVILESPVGPVSGQDVVLSCKFNPLNVNFKPQDVNFYRDEVLLQSGTDTQATVRFGPDHQGAYSCGSGGKNSSPVHMFIPDTSLAPRLLLRPDAEQLFENSSVTFTCEPPSEGWSVRRHRGGAARGGGAPCGSDWGFLGSAGLCVINTTKSKDSALYWCGSDTRRGGSVQLQVKDRGVVLQAPVHPVTPGKSVSLTCRRPTDPTLPARFYRDGQFLSEQPEGLLTLQQVVLSDEGQYMCEIKGERSHAVRLSVHPVKVRPDSTQFFEYQKQVSVSCEDLGPDDWTVWRFTKSGDLSRCGSGWGAQTRASVCDVKTLKHHDSGLYWCESKYRDVSPRVNVIVTGGPVILESPVGPVSGQDVVLSCKFNPQHVNFKPQDVNFYRDEVLLQSGTDTQATVRFDPDHQGAYSCGSGGKNSSPVHMFIPDASLAPRLLLHPDAEQLFEYSSVTFTCEPPSEGWSVRRHRGGGARGGGAPCGSDWGFLGSAGLCVINTTKSKDSALYWCGSDTRRGGSVQLQVKDRGVVLQAPVHPVTPGKPVSLTCRHSIDPALPARFYRDGQFLSEQPEGLLTLQQVVLSDEGQYECEIKGERSHAVRLSVCPAAPLLAEQGAARLSLLHLRYLAIFAPYIASTVLFISIYRQTGGRLAAQRRRRPQMDIEPEYEDAIPNVTTEYQF